MVTWSCWVGERWKRGEEEEKRWLELGSEVSG